MPAVFEEQDGTWKVVVDATEAEDHQAPATVTAFPVELGANVTDHVILGNPYVTLDVSVSDQPVVVPETQADGIKRTSQDVLTYEEVEVDNFGKETSRSAQTYQGLTLTGPLRRIIGVHQAFLEQQKRATLIQVETSVAIYADCILRSVGLPRRAKEGAVFRILVEQVRFGDTATVAALPEKPKKPNGKQKVNLGNKPPKQERNDEAESQSLLSSLSGVG